MSDADEKPLATRPATSTHADFTMMDMTDFRGIKDWDDAPQSPIEVESYYCEIGHHTMSPVADRPASGARSCGYHVEYPGGQIIPCGRLSRPLERK